MGTIRFRTHDGLVLEGELREPDGAARGTAVLCHPDPKHGGSKDHPLLWAIRNELAGRRGLAVLAFNFRGVMGSEGEHGGGAEEGRDVDAAISRVRREAEGPTTLVGWSFGANAALHHAVGDPRVAALALVGIPLGSAAGGLRPFPASLERFRTPTLVVAGEEDPICPADEARALADRMGNARALVIEGGDHFFSRREREPAGVIGRFVDDVLGSGASGGSPAG